MHTLRSYIIGYLLSIVFTLIAPALFFWHEYTAHLFPTHVELRVSFVILALLQLAVQLFFFLNINAQKEHRWNVAALAYALLIVSILVGGTLWIMANLAYMQMDNSGVPFLGGQVTPQMEDD